MTLILWETINQFSSQMFPNLGLSDVLYDWIQVIYFILTTKAMCMVSQDISKWDLLVPVLTLISEVPDLSAKLLQCKLTIFLCS